MSVSFVLGTGHSNPGVASSDEASFLSVINKKINNDTLQKLLINEAIIYKQMLWTNSEYCIILIGNHMLQICSQICAYVIYGLSLIIYI